MDWSSLSEVRKGWVSIAENEYGKSPGVDVGTSSEGRSAGPGNYLGRPLASLFPLRKCFKQTSPYLTLLSSCPKSCLRKMLPLSHFDFK